MLWHRRIVFCEVLLTAMMLYLCATLAVQLHSCSADQCVMLEVCILQDSLIKQETFCSTLLALYDCCITAIIMTGMSDVVQV